MKKKTIKDIPDLSRKRVFLTADFNISLDNGEVANDTRIRETLPTIDYLLGKKAKIIIASHLGRPKGKVDPHLSLAPVAERLSNLTKRKVHLIPEFWKEESLDLIKTIPDNEIVLLENIRFCIGEQENEREFSKHLSKMADLFVNDAFGASHRVHASTVGITQFLKGYAGLLLDKEVTMLSEALENPKRPMTVI
ncbi:phosphoglycerate kinase, partial [Candidatus Gottesmanbacteria bacterium RIFCSPHIGHO2_02_FULL_39_11]